MQGRYFNFKLTKLDVRELVKLKQCIFVRTELRNLSVYTERSKLMLEMKRDSKASKTV